jgi:hypothetical protein
MGQAVEAAGESTGIFYSPRLLWLRISESRALVASGSRTQMIRPSSTANSTSAWAYSSLSVL